MTARPFLSPSAPASAGYVGRFAPSPSGPLHRGSLVAAMASYLDARAHQGRWLLRMEDIDRTRSREDAAASILRDLGALGFRWDEEPWTQSRRLDRYQAAFERLGAQGRIYPCYCSRKEIADSQLPRSTGPTGSSSVSAVREHQSGASGSEARADIYPGTCRPGRTEGDPARGRPLRAWRVRVDQVTVRWTEGEWLVPQASPLQGDVRCEALARETGDFVVARPGAKDEKEWTYQLSVVVDDAESGVTHVIRGMDLIDSTGRQIFLQQCLGLPTPLYWHCPLVMGTDGQKLSKQNGAAAIDTQHPLGVLNQALEDLGLPAIRTNCGEQLSTSMFWDRAVSLWREKRLR